MEAKNPKKHAEQIEILDESTGQIIIKDTSDFDLSPYSNKDSKSIEQPSLEVDYHVISTDSKKSNNLNFSDVQPQQLILLEDNSSEVSDHIDTFQNLQNHNQQLKQQNLINSGLSAHIVQNYSILAQEITAPLESKTSLSSIIIDSSPSSTNDFITKQWNPNQNHAHNPKNKQSYKSTINYSQTQRSSKDSATCQFCGLAMLKKNIPTHIRRAHTPKEELVCLNEEQNIFTFNYLKPGQRRKRSARAYDYSLMTATVSIDEDPCDGIENKFITEGEEILSTDLNQLADRIKYGITQIPISTLNKLIDILAKIEYSTHDEISANAKSIRNMICFYLASGEEFKYKIRQVSEDIIEKKKQVGNLRSDLKEVMTRKAQLERRIQPLVCDLQKLEDQHGNLIESIVQMNNLIQCDILQQPVVETDIN